MVGRPRAVWLLPVLLAPVLAGCSGVSAALLKAPGYVFYRPP